MSLVLLRHGESVANARELFTGILDVGLTPAGEATSLAAGARLAESGWRPDVVVTSELARAWRSAELVADGLGGGLPVQRDWRLNERGYGALSGYRKRDILEQFGREQYLHWRRSYDGRPPELAESTRSLWSRLPPFDRLPPVAFAPTESLSDCLARVAPAWRDGLWPQVRAGVQVLVVAHGNSLRALCGLIDQLDGEELAALNLPNARPLAYEFADDGAPRVRGGSYLDPAAARAEAQVIAAQGGT